MRVSSTPEIQQNTHPHSLKEKIHTPQKEGQWQILGKRSESKKLLKRFFEYLTKVETELVKGNQEKIFKIRGKWLFYSESATI